MDLGAERLSFPRPKRLYGNAALLTLADLATKSASVLLALLIARYLGPEIYGRYATAAAVVDLFALITGLGFERELTRRGGRDPDSIGRSLQLTFMATALSCLAAALALTAFLTFSVYSPQITYLIIVLGIGAVLARFIMPFRYVCLLLGSSQITAIIQTLSTAALAGATLGIIMLGGSVVTIAYTYATTMLLTLLVWLIWLPKDYLQPTRTSPADVLRFVRDAVPFAFSNMLWVAYFNFDTFMLSLMRSEAEVGIYAGVYRIVGINYVVGYALVSTFTPLLFSSYVNDRDEFSRIGRRLFWSMALCGVVLGLSLYWGSETLIRTLVGREYVDGIPIAQVLSLAVLFRMLNYALCEILTTSDRQRLRVVLEAMMLVVNIILNLLLIPAYGGLGAAAATVTAEICLCLAAAWCCWRRSP